MSQITLIIPALIRDTQARQIEDSVRRVCGVTAASAHPESGLVTVTYDPGQTGAWPLVAAMERCGISVGSVMPTAAPARRNQGGQSSTRRRA